MRLLVTGGTGALGRALVRRHLAEDDGVVVVYSRSEHRQAEFAAALPARDRVRFVLGDVRDRARLTEAMGGCEAVIHAAALKRVDAMAYNPSELRKTNIEGSARVGEAAVAAGVRRVLMISSDKAVWPQNAYGVSKAAMEQEAVAANAHALPRGTALACTRWGNVLGSTGSVLQVWRAALRAGEPIRITDPGMTRFWLTVDEAADFALWAVRVARGGEVFIPAFLPATTVDILAAAVAPGARREVVGFRPGGEKAHEVLLTDEEAARAVLVMPPDAPGRGAVVVNPAIHHWRATPPWRGRPLPPGFRYASDAMPVTRLDALIGATEEERAWA